MHRLCLCQIVFPRAMIRADASRLRRLSLLGIPLANIEAPALNALIVEAAEQRRRLSISFVNHHSMVTMRQAPHLARDLQDLDVVGADGIAVVMASRLFRRPGLPGRISADLVGPGLLASMEAKGLRLYLLGGEPGVAEAAAGNILQKYPRLHIAGTH